MDSRKITETYISQNLLRPSYYVQNIIFNVLLGLSWLWDSQGIFFEQTIKGKSQTVQQKGSQQWTPELLSIF